MKHYSIIFLVALACGFAVMTIGLVSMGKSVASEHVAAKAASTTTNTVVPKVPGTEVTLLPAITGKAMLAACALFWVFGILHSVLNSSLHGPDKSRWVTITLFIPALGSVIYFFLAPRPYSRRRRRHHYPHRPHQQGH